MLRCMPGRGDGELEAGEQVNVGHCMSSLSVGGSAGVAIRAASTMPSPIMYAISTADAEHKGGHLFDCHIAKN